LQFKISAKSLQDLFRTIPTLHTTFTNKTQCQKIPA
jgi:hypothetical protein